MKQLKVGQEVFYNSDKGVVSVKISKIGKKYFYITNRYKREDKIEIENLKKVSDFNRVQFYLNKSDLETDLLREKNISIIREKCDIWEIKTLSNSQLERVVKILNEGENNVSKNL